MIFRSRRPALGATSRHGRVRRWFLSLATAGLLLSTLLVSPLQAQAAVAAPKLTVTDQTISWQRVQHGRKFVRNYELATIRNPTTTRDTTYRIVRCCAVTPPAVPGETVRYTLRANVNGSPWADDVSITYPPAGIDPSAPVRGINTNVTGWGSQGPQVLSEMSALGANWIREDLSWARSEPSRGVFDWSSFDNTVALARAAGFQILPILGYAPAWSSPNNAADFGNFVAAAVSRYGPGTTADITYFEVWNEPYYAYAWSGMAPDAGQYANDYVAAVTAGRAANPAAKFLISADNADAPKSGGSCPWNTCWIEDMFTAEPTLSSYIDGISFHPYTQDGPANPLAEDSTFRSVTGNWAFARIDVAQRVFAERGVNAPFWITEVGWSTCPGADECVSEATQAAYYQDLFPLIDARPWIQAVFPYMGRDCCNSDPADEQQYFGLARWPDQSHKPAWDAVRNGYLTLWGGLDRPHMPSLTR